MTDFAAWKKSTFACALLLFLAAAWAEGLDAPALGLYLTQTQDCAVLFVASLAIFASVAWQPSWQLPRRLPPAWLLLLAGLAISALLAFGTYALMGNLPLSRDEHMVVFDMAVFQKGRLAMPLSPEWRPYALALVPKFLLNSDHPTGLVSAYLPVNPMLRLAFSKIADPVWYNPLLVLAGGVALFDVARCTFGADDRACIVVLVVYVLSAQVLVTAMTTYAMTGHLALNIIWLAAFLRGGKLWNFVAIVVGFLAVGLHQIVFHPLFVAPFLLWRLREGQWKLVLLYAAAYLSICLWWASYSMLVSPLVAGMMGNASHDNFLTERVVPALLNRDPRTVPLMLLNLMRFTAWQNLALCPLLVAAVPVTLRQRGLARALLLGILIWIGFISLVLPEQGRGWGYRYLHGYIGSFALLAGFGYRELEKRIGSHADGVVVLLSGVTLVVAMPLLYIATDRFMQPHIAMRRLITEQGSPFVLVDDNANARSMDGRWSDDGSDHVQNRPDLSNRPLVFSAANLTPQLLTALCRKGPVTLITKADMHRIGFARNVPEESPKFAALVNSAAHDAQGCFRKPALEGSRH